MLAAEQPTLASHGGEPSDRFKDINALAITGDQLTRAFYTDGMAEDRLAVLRAYAEREGLTPVGVAARALSMRMGLVGDFLHGPGIPDAEWNNMMEAIARVRIVDDENAVPIGDTNICFDESQFEQLLAFAKELPW
ncbi:hypothetical protein [Sphingobium phenoxybenzoativorans]|uniref:hypothetical protein n=1 Tax=Sphingobium phenoxybenzoativorans TaxID=1592790 RepID=UPI000872D5C9|nr:hypothetical protein [Sphingobium phenoxybenzoativorans]